MVQGIEKWKIDSREIESELAKGTIPNEMICLGCAAKVSLTDTVYPAIEDVRKRTSHLKHVKFQQREDSYYFKADGKIALERVILPLGDLAGDKSTKIARILRKAGSGGTILLFNFTPQPEIEYFSNVLTNMLLSMEDAETATVVGKGHTIQLARIEQETLVMADFINHSEGNLWGLANNDTISTVDPLLPHTHRYPVAIAMNNTLNDLFIFGITDGFILYPSYDARDDESIEKIKDSLDWYKRQFAELGMEIRDMGPLNTNNKLIGATAIGFTDREIPLNAGLVPGQKIIATREIGDLAPLNEYLIRVSLQEDVESIEPLRQRMIQTMMIPNIEAAKIIRDYLPPFGEQIDPARHITATRDMSGPGMLALEELSEDSQCDIDIEKMIFHDEIIPDIEVTNVTAGTNGAILIAAAEGLHGEIMDRLYDAGYKPWIVATVGERSANPVIGLDSSLKKYKFLIYGKGFFKNFRFR